LGLKIDGIAASQHIDSSGEMLHIEGHDISDLVEGRGLVNWEHQNDSPEDIVGKIIFAKKIMKKSDCDNKRQEMFWDKVKTPFVYVISELFDDEKHPGAVACAAMFRYCQKRKTPMVVGFSIEGSTLERQGYELKRSVGRRLALTARPCNKSAISDIYEGDDIEKTMGWDTEPSYRTIEVEDAIFEDIAKTVTPLETIKEAVLALKKTLTAGSYNAAPSTLTQGSALQRESLAGLSPERRKKLAKIVASWDGKSPLRPILKAALPEVSDDYLDHFEGVTQELHLKKTEPSLSALSNGNASFSQDSLAHAALQAVPMIDMKKDVPGKLKRLQSKNSKFLYNSPTHGTMLIKLSVNPKAADKFKDATKYHEIAKNFFKLPDITPNTAWCDHPSLYNTVLGINSCNDYEPMGTEGYQNALQQARQTGRLQQMAIVDLCLGHPSRTWGDTAANGGQITHVNNGPLYKFSNGNPSDYYDDQENSGLGEDMLVPQTQEWLDQLDPSQLYVYLINNTGASPANAAKAQRNLDHIKQKSHGRTFNQLFEELNNAGSDNQISSYE